MLLRRAQRPQPRGQAHPGHGMSFGQGEGAAQPALCPVPSASPCLQPACAVPTALPVLTAPGDETETGAEGHGAALPVPRSIPCRSVSPCWHSHGSIPAQSRGQEPAPLPKGPQPHTEGAARAENKQRTKSNQVALDRNHPASRQKTTSKQERQLLRKKLFWKHIIPLMQIFLPFSQKQPKTSLPENFG